MKNLKFTKEYAGRYTFKFENKEYVAEKVNYGTGNEWNLLVKNPNETMEYGYTEEWCNTYGTLKDLKWAVLNN